MKSRPFWEEGHTVKHILDDFAFRRAVILVEWRTSYKLLPVEIIAPGLKWEAKSSHTFAFCKEGPLLVSIPRLMLLDNLIKLGLCSENHGLIDPKVLKNMKSESKPHRRQDRFSLGETCWFIDISSRRVLQMHDKLGVWDTTISACIQRYSRT